MVISSGGAVTNYLQLPSADPANVVVETLERFGVKTRWNGDVDERIAIRPFEWQRRQFTKAPK